MTSNVPTRQTYTSEFLGRVSDLISLADWCRAVVECEVARQTPIGLTPAQTAAAAARCQIRPETRRPITGFTGIADAFFKSADSPAAAAAAAAPAAASTATSPLTLTGPLADGLPAAASTPGAGAADGAEMADAAAAAAAMRRDDRSASAGRKRVKVSVDGLSIHVKARRVTVKGKDVSPLERPAAASPTGAATATPPAAPGTAAAAPASTPPAGSAAAAAAAVVTPASGVVDTTLWDAIQASPLHVLSRDQWIHRHIERGLAAFNMKPISSAASSPQPAHRGEPALPLTRGFPYTRPVLLHISWYTPMNPQRRIGEFIVSVDQTLEAFRDALTICLCEHLLLEQPANQSGSPGQDGAAFHDASHGASHGASQHAPAVPPSARGGSFLFIEGTFYVDSRSGPEHDLSEPIRKWVTQNERYAQPHLRLFNKKTMAETRWRDLDIRLNVPYLFRHLGNCDHTLRITEVHEANALCHVPQTLTSGPIMYKQCGACQRRVAKYLTMDDIHAHTNPAFWCAHCFDLVHFTATGEPQYQAYKVFPLTWIDS